MGRFYAGAPSFGFGPAGRSAAVAPSGVPDRSGSMRLGPVVRAAPPNPFGPFLINPEFIGAPVRKPFTPPYADERTLASLAPPTSGVPFGRFGYTMPHAMTPVPSAHPMSPPAAVQAPFRSGAQQKAVRAAIAVAAAQSSAAVANRAQLDAAAAAYDATQAQTHAAMNPHPVTQQAATQAVARANLLANHARVLATTAAQQDVRAQKATAQNTDTPLTNSGYQNAGDPGSVYTGDGSDGSGGSPQLLPSGANDLIPGVTTGGLVPGATVSGGLVADHPYATAAGAAGVGFLVGGPIGALIGLLGGGAYAYRQAQAAQAATTPTIPASWGPLPQAIPGNPASNPMTDTNLHVDGYVSGGAAAMASLRGYRW